MAMESSTLSSFPVFIDTNLGTHLSLMVNRDDTVAQLKGKIMCEHPHCFPQIGEISVEALKVKYGEIYYHLPDSMIVRVAFTHIDGARFLNIDLVPALCTINNKTQAVIGDDDVQPQNCNLLLINHNAGLFPTRNEVRHLGSIPSDMETKKGLVPISVPREHENTILPGACEQTPSGLETAQIEEQAISGAHAQQSSDNDTDFINTNEREELEHRDAAVETRKDAPLVSHKNEKYQKHNSSLHGDEFLSENHHGGKRKHKNDVDVNFGSFQEAAVQFDSSMQAPSNVKLRRKKKRVLSSNDELPQNNPADESLPEVDDAAKENQITENFVEVVVGNGKVMGKESEIVVPKEANSLHSNIPQVESLGQAGVDAKRKRRKKVLEEPPQNKLINDSLDEVDTSAQEKPIGENHVKEITDKNVKLGTNSEISVTHGHDLSSKVNATSKEILAQEIQVGKVNATSKEIQAQEIQVQEIHEETIPQNNPVDESLPKVDDAANENQTTEIFVEVMVSKNKDMRKETETVVPKEANSLHSNIPQVESLGQAGVDTKRKRRKKVLGELPQNKPINNSLGEINASAQEKPIKESRVEEITNKNVKFGKTSEIAVTHGHDSSGKVNATSKEIQGQEIQENQDEMIPRNNPDDESLPKVDDTAKEKQTTENFVEVMVSKNKDIGKESEIVVPKEANSLHNNLPQVESLGQAGVDTKRKRRKKVIEEPPQNKLINSSFVEVDTSAQEKPIKENCVEEITNKNVKLGKTSEIATHGHGSSGKVNVTSKDIQAQEIRVQEDHAEEMNKENHNRTTAADSFVDESKITLSPVDKKKRRKHKIKEKTEPLVQELQSGIHEIVSSSTDQVTLNLPKAPSVNHLENSGLTGKDGIEDISNDKKPKRNRKKSEKIEHQETTMQSNTQKKANSTADQVKENSMKELPDNATKVMEATTTEAAACDKKPKRSRKRTANIEPEHLTSDSGHPLMDTTVQVKTSDQKSKRSKKSEKADFPSKESSVIEEPAKENFAETSTGKIGHTNENPVEVSRTVDKIIGAELDWANNQIEAQKHIVKNPVGSDFVSNVSKNEKAAKVNQEEVLKGKTGNTDRNVKILSGTGDNKTTAELNNANSKEVPQADTEKIDFLNYFGRNAKQHEVVEEKTSKKTKRERKLKTSPHNSTATVKISKHDHNITEKRLQESNSSKQSSNSPASPISKPQVDATRKHESKDTNVIMVSNNNSGVVVDIPEEGYIARGAASDDSTEDDTPNQRITSGSAIQKVQNNSFKSKLSKYHEKKLAPATIFDDDDSNSGSSVDDFLICSRPDPGKTSSGFSSETDDSDSASDETNISLGAADAKGITSAFDNPMKSSRKTGSISTILMSTKSYRKAKLTASQPDFDDFGSQTNDVVFETQPESPEI